MKKERLKQIVLSLLVVLSLSVSSIAACACDRHHTQSAGSETNCHEQMAMPMAEDHYDQNSANESPNAISESEHCSCAPSAPKVSSKQAIISIEKQIAEIIPTTEIKFQTIPQIVSVNKISFAKPFYLSDSTYNIKSPRAPPRL